MTPRKVFLDINIMVQVALITGFVFGALLLGTRLLVNEFLWRYRDLSYYLNNGAALFWLWLVVTSAVRSVHGLRKQANVLLLWLAGGATALISVLMAAVLLGLAANMGLDLGAGLPGRDMYLFALVLGLVFSLIALIHLKVRNKGLGNTLEIIVFVGILAILLYLS